MPDQISNAEKEARARRAAEVAAAMEQSYLQSWVGQALPVLFEEPVKGREPDHLWRGHAPNYVEVWAASEDSLHNIEKSVRITGVTSANLEGEI